LNGSTSGTVTIQPQAIAGTFNFNLPTTSGTAGQVLSSGGGGAAAMTWATPATVTSVAMTVPSFLSIAGSPITSSGTLAVTLSGTALPVLNGGTGSTTATGSGSVVLAISPTISTSLLVQGSTTTPSRITTTSTSGFLQGLTATAINNTGLNAITSLYVGQDTTARNGGYLGFNFVSAGSTSNYMTIGLNNQDRIMNFLGDGTIDTTATTASTSKTTGGLRIAGGLGVVGQVTSSVSAIQGSTSGVISIKPQAIAGTYNFNLPTTAGSAGQYLTSTGGAGSAMTWSTPGSPLPSISINSGQTLSSSYNIYVCVGSSAYTILLPDATLSPVGFQITILNQTATLDTITLQNNTASTLFSILPLASIQVTLISNGTSAGSWAINSLLASDFGSGTNTLNLKGLTSGTVSIKTQNIAGTYNLNLPTTAGSAKQVLTSQGGGSTAMTWTDMLDGTFTPGITGQSSALSGLSYSIQTGVYVKTGRQVTIHFDVVFSYSGSALANAIVLTGLPYSSSYIMLGNCSNDFSTLNGASLPYLCEAVGNALLFYSGGSSSPIAASILGASSQVLTGSVTYIV
jgi:hypothetical protein